jgi:hypothetical protein
LDLRSVSPESVHSAGKDVDDGEQILGKLPLGAEFSSIENQDFATILSDHVFEQLESEASKAVFVGDHKRKLCALCQSVQ